MLLKSKISSIKIHSDEWFAARLAKFTSSEIHNLLGGGFQRYVRLKIGEEVTGKSAKDEVNTPATMHGNMFEAEAIKRWGNYTGIDFLVTQQLIADSNSRFGSTPDFLIVVRESPDKLFYEVETGEVKCPPTYDNYLLLFECKTPQDLKKAKKEYYWQVLDQMDNCEALRGHFIAYHPDFKVGNGRHIVFERGQYLVDEKGKKTFPIHEDLKSLKAAKQKAVVEFDLLREELLKADKW